MNKNTYPREPLTWGRLEKLISQMSSEQKEREVLGYGFCNTRTFSSLGTPGIRGEYAFVKLRKLLITNETDKELCDAGQPVLLY